MRISAAALRPLAPALLAAFVTVAGCAVTAFLSAPARSDVAPQSTLADQRAIFAQWALRLTRAADNMGLDTAVPMDRIDVPIPAPRLPISAQWARVMASDPAGIFASPCRPGAAAYGQTGARHPSGAAAGAQAGKGGPGTGPARKR